MTKNENENTPVAPKQTLELLTQQIETLHAEVKALKEMMPENKLTLVIGSEDLDKAMTAFIIAAGAISMGISVVMYFTFWGLNVLKQKRTFSNKSFTKKMMAMMMPGSNNALPISKLNMFGAGTIFLKHVMKEHHVASLQDLIALNLELGVKMISCQMSMDVMGIHKEELLSGLEYAGAANCVNEIITAKIAFYI